MHRGTLRSQGTVPELTRALPAEIQFTLSPGAPVPPLGATQATGAGYQIETFELQADLKRLLDWADGHDVELHGLSAAPTRLDDVFRAIETDPVPTPTH
jgi:ABC-2 type transport system ATP-binding protein